MAKEPEMFDQDWLERDWRNSLKWAAAFVGTLILFLVVAAFCH